MKTIELTQGFVTIVDNEDYEELMQYKWCASRTSPGYAKALRAAPRDADGKTHHVYMHREIMNAPKGMVVDHINHEPLDNRRANLRVCTHAQNLANQHKQRGPRSSRFKGVSWYKAGRKWCAYVNVLGRRQWLGYFDDEVLAARVYNGAAAEAFGEFALLNIIE